METVINKGTNVGWNAASQYLQADGNNEVKEPTLQEKTEVLIYAGLAIIACSAVVLYVFKKNLEMPI